jgi:hypothetical protein
VQTGQILVPDFVTAVVQLVTGIGLLGVAALVQTAHIFPRFSQLLVTNISDHQRVDRVRAPRHPAAIPVR